MAIAARPASDDNCSRRRSRRRLFIWLALQVATWLEQPAAAAAGRAKLKGQQRQQQVLRIVRASERRPLLDPRKLSDSALGSSKNGSGRKRTFQERTSKCTYERDTFFEKREKAPLKGSNNNSEEQRNGGRGRC